MAGCLSFGRGCGLGLVLGVGEGCVVVWGTPSLALNGGSGTDAVSGFVRLAVHSARSDSSSVKCHEMRVVISQRHIPD